MRHEKTSNDRVQYRIEEFQQKYHSKGTVHKSRNAPRWEGDLKICYDLLRWGEPFFCLFKFKKIIKKCLKFCDVIPLGWRGLRNSLRSVTMGRGRVVISPKFALRRNKKYFPMCPR